jgi:hypothetical protein
MEMFNRFLRSCSIAAILFAMLVPAFAWDEAGHKITAYIAWQQMTPEVRERVLHLLRSAPEDAQLSTFYMPYGSRSEEARKREFFMIAATWADIIKDRDFPVRNEKYNHSNWHYHDTLWMEKNGKVIYLPDTGEGGQLMLKLADFDKVIRGPSSDADKAIAVAWLEHLIGDLHQPLHTTGHALGADDKKGDQGGNLFSLTPKGAREKMNLHFFWDTIIGQNIPNKSDLCEYDYLEPIAQDIMKAFPFSSVESRLARDKYDVWEKESVDIATTEVYKGVKRYELPSDGYKKKALRIGEERMALGGYRLGELFNEVFGTAPIKIPPIPARND